ncbi:serine phosphatase RsbU (regulator of sigma subunit) [Haloferula luteola]|uniref:Serine phosphatase RsbU (Regulator of sigma subunit) n=1 Tax=Haloferula luteola TaxID=595692 RepID=A0A840V465_9BACT|nr:serine phosphatase RsbU (regulator of sigma subunit) [Haloferula luteola]
MNHLVLLLGDAMGHGMAPALIATELRAILRASIRLGVHHRVLVESMNEQLCDDLPDGHFMTLLMGRLDRQRCLFRWISFGQAPLLLWREKSKKVEVMHAQRPPLGLMRMPADYVPEVTLFDEGDVFLALSDGFFEARNGEGSCWGLEGAKNLLRKEMESAQALATACVRCVEEFSENAPAQDDRTVLVIRRCRGEAEVGGR